MINLQNQYKTRFLNFMFTVGFYVFFVLMVLSLTTFTAKAAANPELKYAELKKDVAELHKDKRRSQWREPWQKLAKDFLSLYTQNKKWKNRVSALFTSGMCLNELSTRSKLNKDAEEAVKRYNLVVRQHPNNAFAGTALFNMARLQAEYVNDTEAAVASLHKMLEKYPKNRNTRQAKTMLRHLEMRLQVGNKKIEEPISGLPEPVYKKQNIIATLSKLSWSTRNNVVRIVVGLDKEAPWELRSIAKNNNVPNRLVLDLSETKPDDKVSAGSRIKNSPLSLIRLDYSKLGNTRILMDFNKLACFSIFEEDNNLVILAAAQAKYLPSGIKLGNTVRSAGAAAAERRTIALRKAEEEKKAFRNMASQFGLNVRTIVIDAGHGGKDPGTSHNGILERDLTLDLAMRMGKLLSKHGFDIKYTRTANIWVPLDERAELASKYNGDLFISLHVNASPNSAKSGLETFYLDATNQTAAASLASIENMLSQRKLGELEKLISDLMRSARKDESRRLAKDIQKNTLRHLAKNKYPTIDGGSRGAPFVVLINSKMPGILVEVGYCSNVAEAKRMAMPKYRDILVQGLVNGVLAYTNRLQELNKK